MKYALRVLALGHSDLVEITGVDFAAIKAAREQLSGFGKFTEDYRVLLENYRRLEAAKHDVELDNLLYGFGAYAGVRDIRVRLNSAIVAYLASARYFLDASDKLLPPLIGAEAFQGFERFRSNIYDTKKEYMFTEALRNYVQHRGLPLDNIRFHNFVEDRENHESSALVTALSLQVMRANLENDDRFKKTALLGMPDQIDLIHVVRVHMSGMWSLHNYVIENHGAIAMEARNVISRHRETFAASVGGSLVGLSAVSALDDGVIDTEIPLLLDWDDARIDALKRIGNLSRLDRWYISGKIQSPRN